MHNEIKTKFLNDFGKIEFISRIAKFIVEASHSRSNLAAGKILDVLMEHLPIKACSLYSYLEITKHLTLRSQKGFDYKDYSTLHIPLDSLAGEPILKDQPVIHIDIRNDAKFKNKQLVEKYGLTSFVAIPLDMPLCIETIDKKICQKALGVLCLYPSDTKYNKIVKHFAIQIAPLLASAYSYSVEFERTEMRKDIVQKAMYVYDLNSFLHKVVHILRNNWNYDAASIFIFDEKSKQLPLRGTTGMEGNLKKFEMYYQPYIKSEEGHYTVASFNNDECMFLMYPKTKDKPDGKYKEKTRFTKRCALFVPIKEPPNPSGIPQKPIGVLRVINRTIARGSRTESCYFGWEDISRILFCAEVVGLISFLFMRAERVGEDFERAIHGIRKNINAIQANMHLLQRHGDLEKKLSPALQHVVPNCISFLEAFDWQIDKLTSFGENGSISMHEVKLGSVLMQVIKFIDGVYPAFNIDKVFLTNLKEKNFFSMPHVYSNTEALQIVFRNLAENALKYCKRDQDCTISLNWMESGKFVEVRFSDQGIGIPNKDQPYIFLEGFRGEEAMRRHSEGAGLGLAQCKEIMKRLSGDLHILPDDRETIFIVKIPKYEGLLQ